MADVLGGPLHGTKPPPTETAPPPTEASGALFTTRGKMSYFGGPDDMGVSQQEGLAFHYEINEHNQHLFLPIDEGTGLARRLNPAVLYLAARWDYSKTSKEMLANSGQRALVRSVATGRAALAWPADWGPAGPESDHDTGRVADLSPGLCEVLDLETDDLCEVIYPGSKSN